MILNILQLKLIEAQKAGDAAGLEVLRYLLAQIKNREIELRPTGKELNDEEVLKVINKQIKQRVDTIEDFKKSGRQDLIDREILQKTILEEYLADLTEQKCIHEWKNNGLWDGKTAEGKRTGGIAYICTKCGERAFSKESIEKKGGTIIEGTDIYGNPVRK